MLRLDINVLWTIINLLIIYFIAKKFLFKPVRKVLEARQAEIDKQFSDANTARDEAEQLKTQYEQSLEGADREKTQILSQAREKASEEYEKIIADARTDADKIVCDARRMADAGQEKRMRQAQEQIADVVVAATAKLVASRQNPEADRELYNQFIAKTGEQGD